MSGKRNKLPRISVTIDDSELRRRIREQADAETRSEGNLLAHAVKLYLDRLDEERASYTKSTAPPNSEPPRSKKNGTEG